MATLKRATLDSAVAFITANADTRAEAAAMIALTAHLFGISSADVLRDCERLWKRRAPVLARAVGDQPARHQSPLSSERYVHV